MCECGAGEPVVNQLHLGALTLVTTAATTCVGTRQPISWLLASHHRPFATHHWPLASHHWPLASHHWPLFTTVISIRTSARVPWWMRRKHCGIKV